MEKWLTYSDAKKRIGCGKTTFFELIKVGLLKPHKVGNAHLVSLSSVENYLAERPKRRSYIELSYAKKGVQ